MAEFGRWYLGWYLGGWYRWYLGFQWRARSTDLSFITKGTRPQQTWRRRVGRYLTKNSSPWPWEQLKIDAAPLKRSPLNSIPSLSAKLTVRACSFNVHSLKRELYKQRTTFYCRIIHLYAAISIFAFTNVHLWTTTVATVASKKYLEAWVMTFCGALYGKRS